MAKSKHFVPQAIEPGTGASSAQPDGAAASDPDRTRVDHDLRHLGHSTDKGVVGRPVASQHRAQLTRIGPGGLSPDFQSVSLSAPNILDRMVAPLKIVAP